MSSMLRTTLLVVRPLFDLPDPFGDAVDPLAPSSEPAPHYVPAPTSAPSPEAEDAESPL